MLGALIILAIGIIFIMTYNLTKGACEDQTYQKMMDAEYRSKFRDEILYLEFLQYMKKKENQK